MKVMAVLLVAWGVGSCQNDGVTTPDTTPATGQPTVYLETESGDELRVTVEVMRKDPDRRRGMMHREHLDDDKGMLFIMDRQTIQSFWMKDTLIPLDMLFIDSQMRVVGIVHSAEPLTLTSRRVDRPSLYVLEVNGGYCKQRGVPVGAKVRFENVH